MISDTYRVAASCFEPAQTHSMPERLNALRTHLDELLGSVQPDLLVLPEVVLACGLKADQNWGAEPLDGPTVTMVAAVAAAHDTNICIPIIEDDGARLYNTAVYLNRSGKRVGIYRKQVPTCGEVERGIYPGMADQPPVMIDDLRVGTAICFDENFPDQIWHWIEAGVDLLTFPSYTFAGALMRGWAVNCGVPLVCAFPWESVIYDRDGAVLAEAGALTTTVRFGYHSRWVAANLNMQQRVYHLDFNQPHLPELTAAYGAEVDVKLMVRDGRFQLTAYGEVTLDQLEATFGLVGVQKYLRDSQRKASELGGL